MPSRQCGQLCQKQPWTKIATPLPGNARSGFPGSSFTCNRYLRPTRCIARRTTISGLVFLLRMLAIIRLRTSGDMVPKDDPALLAPLGSEARERVRCSSRVDWRVYPQLAHNYACVKLQAMRADARHRTSQWMGMRADGRLPGGSTSTLATRSKWPARTVTSVNVV
jgi:hypothetical protein